MKYSINDILRKKIIDSCNITSYKSKIDLGSFYEWYFNLDYDTKDYVIRLILADYFKYNLFIVFLKRDVNTIDELLLAIESNEDGILSLYLSQLATFYFETSIDKQDIIETSMINTLDSENLPESKGCLTYDNYISKIFYGNILDKIVYCKPYDLITMKENYNEYIKQYDESFIKGLIIDYSDRIYSLISTNKSLFDETTIELIKTYYEWEFFFLDNDSTLGLDDYELMSNIETKSKEELIEMCEDYCLLIKLVHNYFETHRIQNSVNYEKVKRYNKTHIDEKLKEKLNYK